MTEPLLRAAVIGLGVGERHIAGYESDSRCRVTTLCDQDADKLAEVGARHPSCRLTSDPSAVLSDPSIDVVSIASYDDAHHAQIMTALGTGKHVFVEKPVCLHDHELADIKRACVSQPRLKLSSNLILRRCPRFYRLRERLRLRQLGQPYYVEADYNYGRVHKITEGWRGQIPFYSVVHGGAIHMIDLLMWLLDERPVRVTAMGTNIATRDTAFRYNDCVAALLKFPSGAVAKVTSNYSCVFPHHHNLSIYGTDATFVHDRLGARLYDTRDPAAMPRPIDDPYPGTEKGDMLPTFVSAVLDGGEPEVTTKEVFDAMTVSLAIEKSANLDQPVDLCLD